MKIPFTKYHIVSERVVKEKKEREKEIEALRSLTGPYIPEIEQLLLALHVAKIGSSAYERRKTRRQVLQKAQILKEAIEAA